MIPYQINVSDIQKTASIEFHVKKRVAKLASFHERINRCNVLIRVEGKNANRGKVFVVRLQVHIPGKKVFNVKKHDENIYSAIYDAFDGIERVIDKYNQKNTKQFRLRSRDHHKWSAIYGEKSLIETNHRGIEKVV